MKIQLIDGLIILAYLISTIVIGLILKNKVQKDKKAYLLGGNNLPWYMLGLSNASGMFDISGTMWLITLTFVYGMKSIWIPWLWPVFNQVFLMVYLSVWLRRSNVTTGAEWIGTRFGKGRASVQAHTIVVIFALLSCLGFLAYGFIGLGKFVEIFVPWEYVSPYLPFDLAPQYVPHFYGIIFTVFTVIYSILGGMTSIVWADVLQFTIMTVSAVVIAVIGYNALADHQMIVPDGWMSPWFGWELNMDWSGIITEVNTKINDDGYSLFSIFFMLMLFKGLLVSAAGPAPNYDMQKILSAKTPKEGAKMSGFVSIVLMPTRYLMTAGFVALAIVYYDQLDLMVAGRIDFEQILPSAMNQFLPAGLMGLMLAGLLAAFMSTFAGTLNAAQAYVVNDLYLKYNKKHKEGSSMKLIYYSSGILIVLMSIVFGFFALDINDILQWIVSALYGSYVASNVLKWYWWRFNANGYFWGMIAGMIPALVLPQILDNVLALNYFPVILLISVAGCIIGTYTAKPTDYETLKSFYKNVRPWGFWKPVKQMVMAEDPDFNPNKDFKRDMLNVFVGIVAQTALVVLPLYAVFRQTTGAIISAGVVIIALAVLKKMWWDKLPEK